MLILAQSARTWLQRSRPLRVTLRVLHRDLHHVWLDQEDFSVLYRDPVWGLLGTEL